MWVGVIAGVSATAAALLFFLGWSYREIRRVRQMAADEPDSDGTAG